MPSTIPDAPGFPFIGNVLDLTSNPLAFFFRMYGELGPVFRVRAPGRSYIVLAGPDANRSLHDWEETHMISAPVYHPYVKDTRSENVLVGMDGEAHSRYRKWLHPGFSREALKLHLPAMYAAAVEALEPWQAGDILNVTNVFQFLIAQVSGTGLAGCPVGDHFEDTKKFAHTFLGAGVGSYPGFMRSFPGYKTARKRFTKFLTENINAHRQNPPNSRFPDLIDLLLQQEGPHGEPLTETDLLASAHMPYTNSLVYVASTCGFMLYELLKNPDVLEKVQEEAAWLFAEGAPEMNALMRARWLKAALMETQRIHPISLSIPRYVHKPFEFMGHTIEAGEVTLTATAVTHFLPEFFPEPERFLVERYWSPRLEHRQPNVFAPFGLGPHVCISAGIVNLMTMLAVARMVHSFDLSLVPVDYELDLSIAPFPAPERAFEVRIEAVRPLGVSRHSRPAVSGDEILPLEFNIEYLTTAAEKAGRETFPPGAMIIREGDLADAMYIISSGKVSVIKTGVDQQPRIVAELGTGAFFGEIGLLQGVPRTASIRADSTVETIVLDKETFIRLVTQTDLTSDEIAAVMQQRMVATTLAAILPNLPLERIAEMLPNASVQRHAARTKVIRQGEQADAFYILIKGQVDIINEHPDGRLIHLNTLHAGDYFGEIGLLQGRPRNATVSVSGADDAELIVVKREEFLRALEGEEVTNAQIAIRMAERLTQLLDANSAQEK